MITSVTSQHGHLVSHALLMIRFGVSQPIGERSIKPFMKLAIWMLQLAFSQCAQLALLKITE